jgi:hypothetical protein
LSKKVSEILKSLLTHAVYPLCGIFFARNMSFCMLNNRAKGIYWCPCGIWGHWSDAIGKTPIFADLLNFWGNQLGPDP